VEKPRLTTVEKKKLLDAFIGRFGIVPLVTMGLRAIGAEKVQLLLSGKDPGLTAEDVKRLANEFAKVTTTTELVTLAAGAIGIARVNEILDHLNHRPPEVVPPVPTDPGTSPAPVIPLVRPIFVGLTRHWSNVPAARTAQMVKASNATGMCMELIELEPDTIKSPDQMTKYLIAQIQKATSYVAELRKLGLWVKLYGFNTNAQKEDQPNLAQHKQIIDEWDRRIGWEGVLVLWNNEDDANQPRSVYTEASKYLHAKMVARLGSEARASKQLISWQTKQSGHYWTEYHPQKIGSWPSPGKGSVIAPDNGACLRQLGSYFGTKLPNINEWISFVSAAAEKDYEMIECYNANEELSQEWMNACTKAWGVRATLPAPSPGPAAADAIDISGFIGLGPHKGVKPQKIKITRTIKSAKLTSSTLSFEHDPLKWPTNSPIGADIDGRVFVFWLDGGKLTGGHYDWRRPGTRSKDLHNIRAGYLDGKRPPVGAQIWICFVNDWTGGPAERTQVIYAGKWS